MSHINFEIPVTVKSLLEESYEHYYVREVVQPKRIPENLKEAKQLLKEEGVEYMFTYFDTYISVILNISQVSKDVQTIALEDIHRAMKKLNSSVTYVLSDKDVLNDELKLKYVNIIKMIMYVYINMVIAVMEKDSAKGLTKKAKKSTEEFSNVSRGDVVQEINTILQQEIKLFWDPPVIEQPLINLIAEVCYSFIEKNQAIKSDKELCTYIFHIFGMLITEYRYGTQFIYRMAETAKSNEHAVTVISEGIKLLVETYNARGLIREFVKQITEWQSDEKYQNAEGARNCAHLLSEMAKLMPEFMVGEVNYLTEYLYNESYTLRISVLNVITEVMLTTLSKPDLTDEERETRDDFIDTISEHMFDVSAFVRVKVLQNFVRLQKENMLMRKVQIKILDDVTLRLRDKGSNVRKAAANCITSFLEHNPFGSELKLSVAEQALVREKSKYEELQESMFGTHVQKVKEGEEAWKKIQGDVLELMENNINEDEEDEEFNLPKDKVPEIVKMYLQEKKYKEAYDVTRKAVDHFEDYAALRDILKHSDENEFLLKLMGAFYIDFQSQLLTIMEKGNDDARRLNTQQELIVYLEDAVKFLKVLEKAIGPMKDLLECVCISEVQEAMEFFTVSYKFSIDNATRGILEMLKIMQRPEADRKSAVTKALKAIFLETNASSMKQHTKTVVDRLIKFMEIVPFDKVDSFRLVIISWVNEGALDNNVVECAFQYFVKKQDVTDEVSLKALQLLTMIAHAKKSIVMKNLTMISELIFEKRGVKDMLLLSETCNLIAAGGSEQQLITDTKPPFKIKPEDPMWKSLINILCNQFDGNLPFYNAALKSAIKLIYTLCSKPDQLCEEIIITIVKKLSLWDKSGTVDLRCCILIRLCVLVGEVALGQLNFLDETVYKEIKRRLHAAAAKPNAKNKKKQSRSTRQDFSTASSSRRNATNASTITEDGDDSVLDGAQAVDEEAEFILNVLEGNIVTSPTSLGAFTPMIEQICKYPNKFDNEQLQCVAVSALLKYMLVSSKCCADEVRLVFTTLEKSKYPEVKCIIIVFLGDLLERFPNIIEPWSEHLYNRLNDADEKVRKTAFHTLANLLLRDMLLVKNYIGSMATFISAENNDLSNMSKSFFNALATKNSHNLYNVLPDIFTHLVTKGLEEARFRYIMKDLFDLIKSAKHAENLVERLCIKFKATEEESVCGNIAYCLSLLEYNDRAVKKFSENFPCYKHALQYPEVYAFVKQIMNSWSKMIKTDIKTVVAELEDKIATVFQVSENEGGDANARSPATPRATFKKPKRPAPKSKKKRRKHDSDSDEEDNDASVCSSVTRKSSRTRRGSNNSISVADD